MKERPILFNAPMVRAILEDRKTQTRRIVKPPPPSLRGQKTPWGNMEELISKCKHGVSGDRLWVREPLRMTESSLVYEADQLLVDRARMPDDVKLVTKQRLAAMFMPRWASRITLKITDVRAEPLQEISEEDAKAEGIRAFTKDDKLFKYWPCDPLEGPMKCTWQDLPRTARDAFAALWGSINGPGAWAANPWVWAITFKRIKP